MAQLLGKPVLFLLAKSCDLLINTTKRSTERFADLVVRQTHIQGALNRRDLVGHLGWFDQSRIQAKALGEL